MLQTKMNFLKLSKLVANIVLRVIRESVSLVSGSGLMDIVKEISMKT